MKRNAVIIEDDKKALDLAKFTLTGVGFQVFVANSVQEGSKILEKVHVDILVCEYKMRDGVTTSLVANLKRTNPTYKQLPVLMLSQEKDEKKKLEAKACGVTAYMDGPINPTMFLSTVAAIT